MKSITYMVAIIGAMFFAGCGDHGSKEEQPVKAPTAAQFEDLLKKRKASSGGGDFDIPKEMWKYQNMTDKEKIEIFKKVESLVK